MGQRILVIDDEQGLLYAIAEYLTELGYLVHCAREREEAEALLQTYGYALVITDLKLTPNGLSGLDILSNVMDRVSRPKVIVLSGHATGDVQAEVRYRGADAFLQKPKPLAELARVAADLLKATA